MEDKTVPVVPQEGKTVVPVILESLMYTPQAIEEIEKHAHKLIMEAINDFSMDNLIYLLIKGLSNCDRNTAYEAINQWRTNGGDTMSLQIHIINVMEEQGFLSKTLNLGNKIQMGLEKTAKRISEKVSDISGETENE